MDIVDNATRSSSSFENNQIIPNDSKESSSPLLLPSVAIETSHIVPGFLRNRRRARGIRLQKEKSGFPAKLEEYGGSHKQKKEVEVVTNQEKFVLRLLFMSENMFTRQKTGIIVSRLKGKISAEQYESEVITLDTNKQHFTAEIAELVAVYHDEISSGSITLEIIDKILDLFKRISLKEKNINQQNNLRQKIITDLATSGINISGTDPHKSIRLSLLALSVEERAKVLAAIPI